MHFLTTWLHPSVPHLHLLDRSTRNFSFFDRFELTPSKPFLLLMTLFQYISLMCCVAVSLCSVIPRPTVSKLMLIALSFPHANIVDLKYDLIVFLNPLKRNLHLIDS